MMEKEFFPARVGDIVLLVDLKDTFFYSAHKSSGETDLSKRFEEKLSLAKVTQVDEYGYVLRIKPRPEKPTREKKAYQSALVCHADDRDVRRRYVQLWKECDSQWKNSVDAREEMNKILANLEEDER